ncbi:MAG: type III pantothenate kinase [Calditrichaeota bacterium]|nr:MAG: type III pantothenate kinase [Calditrichota bacterium]
MMLLAIDIGNTHIDVGLFKNSQYIWDWRIATGVHRTEDEMMTYIEHFLSTRNVGLKDIDAIAIASVVPHITQIFTRLSDKYFNEKPFIIDHTLNLGITVDYHPPEAVGADRICNAVAAYEKYGGPVIVVDLGTATTLDVISKEGVYIGGAIAPGLETAAWGLHSKASKLPNISLEFPEKVIGKTTEKSMQSGIMFGVVKMIDGLIEMIMEELHSPCKVIATGGLSKLIITQSKYIEHIECHLVLDGIVSIYKKNRA